MHRAHRVHFDTGAGALCGTRAVIGWTTKASNVTCPTCRARLARAAPTRTGQCAMSEASRSASDADLAVAS